MQTAINKLITEGLVEFRAIDDSMIEFTSKGKFLAEKL
jgi:hypothetical protein